MIKVLIIDNNDSFTYNLVEVLRQTKLCTVDVCLLSNLIIEEIVEYQGVILSPGPGLPSERPFLTDVLNHVVGKVPVLGVCLGHQALMCYFGSQLMPLNNIVHGEASKISFPNSDQIFSEIGDAVMVGRYHSWVVNPVTVTSSLILTSQTSDGLIMSFKHSKFNVRGVQFHPESILTINGKRMLENWIQYCLTK